MLPLYVCVQPEICVKRGRGGNGSSVPPAPALFCSPHFTGSPCLCTHTKKRKKERNNTRCSRHPDVGHEALSHSGVFRYRRSGASRDSRQRLCVSVSCSTDGSREKDGETKQYWQRWLSEKMSLRGNCARSKEMKRERGGHVLSDVGGRLTKPKDKWSKRGMCKSPFLSRLTTVLSQTIYRSQGKPVFKTDCTGHVYGLYS